MPKISDTQSVILSAASQRDSGSLVPLPKSLADSAGASTAIKKLIACGLAEERVSHNPATACRNEGDVSHGVFITPAGLTAIGVSEESGDGELPQVAPVTVVRRSNSAVVVELMRRTEGATTAELVEATGWLPHTTRAALSGLRKKGHTIDRARRGSDSVYRIAG